MAGFEDVNLVLQCKAVRSQKSKQSASEEERITDKATPCHQGLTVS